MVELFLPHMSHIRNQYYVGALCGKLNRRRWEAGWLLARLLADSDKCTAVGCEVCSLILYYFGLCQSLGPVTIRRRYAARSHVAITIHVVLVVLVVRVVLVQPTST